MSINYVVAILFTVIIVVLIIFALNSIREDIRELDKRLSSIECQADRNNYYG